MRLTLQTYVCYFCHELCEYLHRAEPNFAVEYNFHKNLTFVIMITQRQEGVSSEQLIHIILHRAIGICRSSMLAKGQVLNLKK